MLTARKARKAAQNLKRKSRAKPYDEKADLGSGSVLGRGITVQPQTLEVVMNVYHFFSQLIEGEGQPAQKIFMLSCMDDVRYYTK